MALLLSVLTVRATGFTVTLNISEGGTVVASGTSGLAVDNLVTLTVTPTDGYYLQSLYYEEVADIGGAEAPSRRVSFASYTNIIELNKTAYDSYAENHYQGTYSFRMPNDNVIVTAIFEQLIDFNPGTTISICLSTGSSNEVYNGENHSLLVKDGITELKNTFDGTNFRSYKITGMTFNGVSTDGNYTIKNAGNYTVTIEGVGKYRDVKSGDLTITDKTLTVMAVAKSKTFGEADPALTYTYNGLLNGDVITGALSRAAGENVGSYTIQQGTLAATNYFISYTANSLTINPKNIGSTATITPSETYYNYDANNDQKATITSVKDGTTTLTSGTDYNVAYSSEYYPEEAENNIRADIHYITVTFIGNYTGSQTVEYQIRKDVTMSYPYRWRTYYETEVNMRVPDGFKAYTFNHAGTTQVELDECLYIKKNEPMLLYRTGDAINGFFPEVVKKNDAGLAGINSDKTIFKWTEADTHVSDLLSANSGRDIWILVHDEFVRTESGTIPAYKCYLVLDKNSVSVPVLPIARRDITGIKLIDNGQLTIDNEAGVWYGIDGCRLNGKPAKKGIYINQGKKIVIK
jgi:hypothetical protein